MIGQYETALIFHSSVVGLNVLEWSLLAESDASHNVASLWNYTESIDSERSIDPIDAMLIDSYSASNEPNFTSRYLVLLMSTCSYKR